MSGSLQETLTVGDEDVTAPSCDHPSVKESSDHAVESATFLKGPDPEVEREHKQEDSNGFVVVGAGNGSGDVSCNVSFSRTWAMHKPGAMPINAAASKPALSFDICLVKLSD
jgi:hypothetical protein